MSDAQRSLVDAEVGAVFVDPHGDPWVRLPGGAVEIVMRPSSTRYSQPGAGGPRRIFHPDEVLAKCADDFGPFQRVS